MVTRQLLQHEVAEGRAGGLGSAGDEGALLFESAGCFGRVGPRDAAMVRLNRGVHNGACAHLIRVTTQVGIGLAEIADEYLKKAPRSTVEGHLKTCRWQDKEGKDNYTTEASANNMQMPIGFNDMDDDIPF